MSAFRRSVVGFAVVLVALRLFFPVRRGDVIDVFATLFQISGILAIVAALFVLGPNLGDQKFKKYLSGAALIVLWNIYILTSVVWFERLGLGTVNQVRWFPTALIGAGLLLLLSLTSFRLRRRWPVVPIGAAIVILFAGGVLGAWQNQWNYLKIELRE